MRPGDRNDYARLCALALRERLRVFRAHTRRLSRTADPECVHQLRVASRRLRCALGMAAPCLGKDGRNWHRGFRRLARELGEARDLDVQRAAVQKFQETARPAHREGLNVLLQWLHRRRAQVQARVAAAVAKWTASGAAARIARWARNTLSRRQAAPGLPLRALAADRIRERLDELLAFAPYVERAECAPEHHAMRIAAKRLRYTMEVLEPAYGRRLARSIRAARTCQQLLGEVHDCDVWIAFLPQFIEQQRRAFALDVRYFRRLRAGLLAFLSDRQRQRRVLHGRFVRLWARLQGRAEWKRLAATVSAHTGARRQRKPPKPAPRVLPATSPASVPSLAPAPSVPPEASPASAPGIAPGTGGLRVEG